MATTSFIAKVAPLKWFLTKKLSKIFWNIESKSRLHHCWDSGPCHHSIKSAPGSPSELNLPSQMSPRLVLTGGRQTCYQIFRPCSHSISTLEYFKNIFFFYHFFSSLKNGAQCCFPKEEFSSQLNKSSRFQSPFLHQLHLTLSLFFQFNTDHLKTFHIVFNFRILGGSVDAFKLRTS